MIMITLNCAQSCVCVPGSASLVFRSIPIPPSTFLLPSFPIRHTYSPSPSLIFRCHPHPHTNHQHPQESPIQDIRVPTHWLLPSNAFQESEWLRVTLHKWLDDEYCPEETNVEISRVAAQSYYKSLLEKQTDMGEILLKMARELESISYQESFHGAFSSANAAVDLIAQRIEDLYNST
ncbi:uncharacterized protein G2W53_043915 [Senna tora]|uniref:Uncharacterized protein n=1 Tax=Senna tora TaxID=362788 RepID=A0A834SJG1_9FABA|nr:uncharacterized protein G2W53_043915 [Senna tora]